MKRITSILVFLAFIGLSAMAQDIQITGKVTSAEDGSPMPGVSVGVKGTTAGVATNIDGNYTIKAPSDATLIFSFVSMATQEVAVEGRSTVDVVMEAEVTGLDEVIVVGYGTATKASFVGSSSVVKSEDIDVKPVSSFDKSLQGMATGMLASSESGTPGSTTDIVIRGVGSINASTDPLYVVDGVPVASGDMYGYRFYSTNPLASLEPSDIESIVILKDASATSIYGARASNGVVVITTKKGKQGKTVFEFNTQIGQAERVTNNFQVCNAAEYKELIYEQWVNAGVDPAEAFAQIQEMGDYDTDWASQVFRKGIDQKYNLSASGGTDKTTFFIAGNYRDQQGIVIGSEMKRYSARINLDQKVSDRVSLGFNSSTVFTNIIGGAGGGYYADPVTSSFFVPPIYPVRNEDGTYFQDIPENLDYNPVSSALVDKNGNTQRRYLGNAYVQIELLKGLKFKSNGGGDYFNLGEDLYWSPKTPSGQGYNGYSENASLERFNWIVTNTLQYNNVFDVHSIDVLVGQEAQKLREFQVVTASSNFPSDRFYTMSNAATPLTASSTLEGASLASFFASINYNYDNKYYLALSGRRDGSSRFGANNRWANFGSVGASWRISQEGFMAGLTVVDDLKLRASYGTSGNQDIFGYNSDGTAYNDYYPSLGLYQFGQDYNGQPGSGLFQLENPDLKWEKNENMNIGLDLAILKSRISGTVEYYIKNTKDLLLNVPISSTTGVRTITKNVGAMRNKGLEFDVTTRNVDMDFKWTTTLSMSFNKNEVTKLNNDEPIYDGNTRQQATVGHPYQTFYLVRWAGVNPADGSAMWYDADNNPVMNYADAERVLLDAKADPDFYGTFTNMFSYKGVELSISFYGIYGNSIFNNSDRYLSSDGGGTANVDRRQLARWQEPGDITDVPKRVDGASWSNKNSTRHLEDGSYLKLKDVTLSYNLPKNLLDKMMVQGLRIYMSAENAHTWTKYTGWDPESSLDGTSWFKYPNAKTYSVGIDLKF
jgi:TonB-dependent starch-binding outer membrane protein SusC